jgi:hypothetical protein
MPTNRVLEHRGYLQRNATKEKRKSKKKNENETPTRLDWEGRDCPLCTPTFTHLHQRQPARSEAAAMVLSPALAWATASLDSEITGADGVHVVHESPVT